MTPETNLMHAVVHDAASAELTHGRVPRPVPAAGQALVRVGTTSLNFLDLAYRHDRLRTGDVPGVDAAGIVERAAADGSGPPVDTRVVAFAARAWAELVAADTADLAVVPDAVSLADAVALPAAGVTARQALRTLGDLAGGRVLVTGASGGVGRFAVQLAHLAGASVVAAVGRPERAAGLLDLGADMVVTDLSGLGPVDAVLDTIGGPLLADAFHLVRSGGVLLSIGQSSGQPTTLDLEAERTNAGGNRWLSAFTVQQPFADDLAALLALVAEGRLAAGVGWHGSWRQVNDAARALANREVLGKVVLDVD